MATSRLQSLILNAARPDVGTKKRPILLSRAYSNIRLLCRPSLAQWPTLSAWQRPYFFPRAIRLSRFSTSVRCLRHPLGVLPSPSEAHAQPGESRLSLTFTCTAPLSVPSPGVESGIPSTPLCNHRSTHTFTKNAYQKGVVIIECPSCKNKSVSKRLSRVRND
ncbi:uncharacterized protein EI90DRAFT_3062975 [Cantharellus anzutake]|uniref:uncharacterized protein n=1 Tax=Cantharellus anzutake TaxID=1750568 RepID=UPI001907F6E0|nr:uncharacterized protein EI90DRAFT_3062975 [Cantharellus anzutake]KAF8329552.1 hypothetical protein EI90DRAFT_3062975 [Cantharellus anzutake]